jgi:N-acetylmuramoyl-L-alanine amidase CwlA
MGYTLKTKIANKSNYGNKRNLSDIKCIVIHYTTNDGDTDENNGKYFVNNIVKTSAHYFVDDDSITQSVPDDYVAYSVGGNKYSNCASTGGGKFYGIATNANTLNIEICDDVKNGVVYPSQATIDNAIAFTKVKMKEYNISKENVIRHFDVTGKSCPAYWVDDTRWKSEFWNKLSPTVEQSTISPITVNVTLDKSYVYKNVDYRLVFDPVYYSNTYVDLKKAFGTNESSLLDHFVTYGMKEGRQGCDWFNVHTYKSKYTDLQKAFGSNLKSYYIHFIDYGYKEGRNGVENKVSIALTDTTTVGNSIIEAGKQHAFNFTGDVEFYKREYARLIKACKEYNVPLEINCYGIRDNRHYPRKELWELVGEIGAPVVTGMDAHSEESAYDEGSLKFVELMVKTYNLNFLRDFNVKILNK